MISLQFLEFITYNFRMRQPTVSGRGQYVTVGARMRQPTVSGRGQYVTVGAWTLSYCMGYGGVSRLKAC